MEVTKWQKNLGRLSARPHFSLSGMSEFNSKGASVVYEPRIIEAYTMKEFAIRDLDGYVLAFGQDWPNAKAS